MLTDAKDKFEVVVKNIENLDIALSILNASISMLDAEVFPLHGEYPELDMWAVHDMHKMYSDMMMAKNSLMTLLISFGASLEEAVERIEEEEDGTRN